MNESPTKNIAIGLLFIGLGGFFVFTRRESLNPDRPSISVPVSRSVQQHFQDKSYTHVESQAPTSKPPTSTSAADYENLIKAKAKAMEHVKEWETNKAKPLTKGYKLGEKAVTLIPPADPELMNTIKKALGHFSEDPMILNEVLASSEIQIDKYRVLMYKPNQVDASQDTVSTFNVEKYDDVRLDPVTGNLVVTTKVFHQPRPGNFTRYMHLFKVHEEN